MGLPPLIDYGGAGGYVYGKPVQLPPPATAATAGAGVTAAAGAGVRGGTLKSASKNPIHAQDAAAKRRLSRKSAASGGSAASAAAPLVAATSAASAAAAEASGSGAPLPPPQYLQAALPSLSSTSAAATAVRGPLVVTTGQGHLLMAATNVTRPHTRRKDRQPTNEIIGGNMDGQRIKCVTFVALSLSCSSVWASCCLPA